MKKLMSEESEYNLNKNQGFKDVIISPLLKEKKRNENFFNLLIIIFGLAYISSLVDECLSVISFKKKKKFSYENYIIFK